MVSPLDHVLVVVVALLFPLRAAFSGVRRLRAAPPADRPRLRLRLYRVAIAIQWALTLAVGALWVALGRPWVALGLVPHAGMRLSLPFVAVAALAFVLFAQARAVRRSDAARARVASRLAGVEAMLPHDRAELSRFRALAITAGVCEETLYRGYLLWYALHWLAPVWAVVATSLVFGFGHLYQGPRGMLMTAAVGALLAMVYVVSGSLYPGMLAHALVDLHAGELASAALVEAVPPPEGGAT